MMHAILVFSLFVSAVLSVAPSIEVHRLMQVDRGNDALGSRRTAFNLLASSSSATGDLSRRVVLIKIEDCNCELVEKIFGEQRAGALLVLLPQSLDHVSESRLDAWRSVEECLMEKERQAPIYFAVEDEQLTAMTERVASAEASATSTDDFRLVVTAPEPTKLSSVSISNFQGWLTGGGNTPGTIALIAYYDSLAAAPSLAYGANSNGGGIVAVLEIARLFRKLYDGQRSQGNYNLLFLLSGGGRLNFAGTKHWVSSTDARLLESVVFALCLDSIAGSDKLFLNVAKPPKDPKTIALHEKFVSTAKAMNIPFEIVHKKVNLTSNEVLWEHEHFSRARGSTHRISAATLSSLDSANNHRRSTIFDKKINLDILKRNIAFIAEVLGGFIFNVSSSNLLFQGTLGVSDALVDAWSNVTSTTPRVSGYPSNKPHLIDTLFRSLKNLTWDATKQQFKLETDISFYVNEDPIFMSAFTVKPWSFDVILSAVIAAYLFGLFVVLVGWEDALRQIKNFLSSSSNRRRKTQNKKKD